MRQTAGPRIRRPVSGGANAVLAPAGAGCGIRRTSGGVELSSLCEIVQAQTRKHEHRSRSDFAQSVHESWALLQTSGSVLE